MRTQNACSWQWTIAMYSFIRYLLSLYQVGLSLPGFGATTVKRAEKSTLNPGCIGYPAWISERPNWLRFASTMLITCLLRKVLSKGYGGEKVGLEMSHVRVVVSFI